MFSRIIPITLATLLWNASVQAYVPGKSEYKNMMNKLNAKVAAKHAHQDSPKVARRQHDSAMEDVEEALQSTWDWHLEMVCDN